MKLSSVLYFVAKLNFSIFSKIMKFLGSLFHLLSSSEKLSISGLLCIPLIIHVDFSHIVSESLLLLLCIRKLSSGISSELKTT